MKRLTILISTAIITILLISCRKQEWLRYSYGIEATASIDYKNQQTLVTFSSVFQQENAEYMPKGNALLIFSATRDMNVCETLTISDFPFSGGTHTFYVSEQQRPLDQEYWYFIELQAPFSEPLKSQIYEMPVVAKTFSTRNGDFILFAPGNLQYRASTNTWRFADNQYDIIGKANQNISSSYNGYIDLFGYGTSGYYYKPYSYVLTASYYATGNIANTKNDWGVYCSISNGGNYKWRTLESDDWIYIYEERPNASSKRSRATINGVKGMILLPDEWAIPSGCSFVSNASSFSTNTYSASKWQKMENAGAVFLPAAGHRIDSEVKGLDNSMGSYFSSTWDYGGTSAEGVDYCTQPIRFYFSDSNVYSHAIYTGTNAYNAYGSAVRLVRTVQTTSNAPRLVPRMNAPHGVAPM